MNQSKTRTRSPPQRGAPSTQKVPPRRLSLLRENSYCVSKHRSSKFDKHLLSCTYQSIITLRLSTSSSAALVSIVFTKWAAVIVLKVQTWAACVDPPKNTTWGHLEQCQNDRITASRHPATSMASPGVKRPTWLRTCNWLSILI